MSISCTLDIRLVSRPQTVRFAVYSHSSLFPIRTMLDNEDQCVSSDLGRVFKKLVWPFYLSLEYWKKPLFSCREGETRRDSEKTVWPWKVLHQEMSVLRLRPTQRAIAKTAPFQNQVKWPAAQFSSVFNHKVNSVFHKVVTLVVISVKKRMKRNGDKLFMTTTTYPTWQVYVRLCTCCQNEYI